MINYKKLVFITSTAFLFSLSNAQDYKVLSERNLNADGAEGIETYALIKSVLGPNPIEAPDLYPDNHPEVKHIYEESDTTLGNYFAFIIHRDIDKDRDTDNTDRQRNEIKAYSGSDDELKAFHGESLRYHWFFQLEEGFSISKNFSHFFQLKAVGGNYSSQPIATISGSINSGNDQFEFIHSSLDGSTDTKLTYTDWEDANTGKWMAMEVFATYKDSGYLSISVKDLDGNIILETVNENIDMWREGSEFVRPKWGIYRSLATKQYLNPGEEKAQFANFTIQKTIPNYIPVPPAEAANPYPYNNAENIDTVLNLKWEAGEGSQYHKIYLSENTDFSNLIMLDSTENAYIKAELLAPSSHYFWKVESINEDGVTTSNTWAFETAKQPTLCTNAQLLLTSNIEASGELSGFEKTNIADNNIETGWTTTDDNAWITLDLGAQTTVNYLMIGFYMGDIKHQQFKIQTSNNNIEFTDAGIFMSNGMDNYPQKIILPESMAQYIRFTKTDSIPVGQPIITEMYAFGCGDNYSAPLSAQLIAPENNQSNAYIPVKFSWREGLGTTTHRIYLGESEPLNEDNFITETSESEYAMNELDHKQKYFWRIDEVNEHGTTMGDVWNFTTVYETTELYIQENTNGFISVDGEIENIYGGYTGEGYANTIDNSGSEITWKVNAMTNSYTLKLRYAHAFENNASAFLKINDKAIGILSFSPTDTWETWAIDSAKVALIEGENTISLSAISTNGLANIDYFYLSGENLSPITSIKNHIKQNPLNVKPNPFNNELLLTYNGSQKGMVRIKIYTTSGQLVYMEKNAIQTVDHQQFKLKLAQLKRGLYIINFHVNDTSCYRKIIKQ